MVKIKKSRNDLQINLRLQSVLSRKTRWLIYVTIILMINKFLFLSTAAFLNFPNVAKCETIQGFNSVAENAYNLYTCKNELKLDNAIFALLSYDDYWNVYILWVILDVFMIVFSLWLLGAFIVHEKGSKLAAEYIFPYVTTSTIAFAMQLIMFGIIINRYSNRPSPIRNEYFGQLFFIEDSRTLHNLRKKYASTLVDLTTVKLATLFLRMTAYAFDFCWSMIILEKYNNEPGNFKLMRCDDSILNIEDEIAAMHVLKIIDVPKAS